MWYIPPYPQPFNHLIPDICSIAPLVSKVARSCVQPWTQVTIDNNNTKPSSTLYPHTTTHSYHFHLVPLDVIRRLPTICPVVATVARVILLQHWRLLSKDPKKQGGMGQNTQEKLILPIKSPLFGLQRTHTFPISNPPFRDPICAQCTPLWRCTLCQVNKPTQQRSANDEGGKREVFFPRKPTVFQIFLPITFFTLYNFVILFSHLFFSKLW